MYGTSSVWSHENFRTISSSAGERSQSRRSPWPPLRNKPQKAENRAAYYGEQVARLYLSTLEGSTE